jgi:RNA polymerase sigma-70 factor (ECF subfamily)
LNSGNFETTRWDIVLAAGAVESGMARAALEVLCRVYWRPLYVFARRKGYSPHDAEDLTQEFIASLLRRNALRTASPARGRFRNFLLTSFKHFLADEWDRSRALKRGGGAAHVPFDISLAELAFKESESTDSPDRQFDLAWARTLIDTVLDNLREQYAESGKSDLFEILAPLLTGGSVDFESATARQRLGMEEGAMRVALHRFRKRYREALREHVAATLAPGEHTEDEIRALMAAISH